MAELKKKRTFEQYEQRAAVLKALGHPTRLFIVDQLAKGEHCVCELQKMIGDDISTVSKHLTQLKNAGLVRVDKRGTQVFYQLRMRCVTRFIGCVEDVLRNDVKQKMKALK